MAGKAVTKQPKKKKAAKKQQEENEDRWMPFPDYIPDDCILGLEWLHDTDFLKVEKSIKAKDWHFGGDESFYVMNRAGQLIYSVKEKTTCMKKLCTGPAREVHLIFSDNTGFTVMEIWKEANCDGILCLCCINEMEMETRDGTFLTRLRQAFNPVHDQYDLYDENGVRDLSIISKKFYLHRCNTENKLKIVSNAGDDIGYISKYWGPRYELKNADHEVLWMSFPRSLEVRVKAAIIGAAFCMHYIYMEVS